MTNRTGQTLEVVLAPIEMMMGGYVGLTRRVVSLNKGMKDAYGMDSGLGYSEDIIGALGELAFCKALNLYWGGTIFSMKGPDVGSYIQIRAAYRADYNLIIRPADKDQDVFVLVLGSGSRFRVMGWIHGADAKIPVWQRSPNGRPPAYFVPQASLLPMDMFSVYQETMRQIEAKRD